MTSIRRIAVVATLASATLVLATLATLAASQADTATGADFGQHMRTCAQAMALAGSDNPGMHHGHAGWNGMPCDI
jgi:hypothetical protein